MPGYRLDSLRAVRLVAVAATGSIGSGANGVVTTTVDATGWAGNAYTIRVVLGVGLNQALAAAVSTKAITVTLATDGAGAPDDTANTATLIAAAVDALAGVSAAASGSGATPISAAISAVTFSGGRDVFSKDDLAREANVSHGLIDRLEDGGTCGRPEADRIASALTSTLNLLGASAL